MKVINAGRRWGKSLYAVNECIREALIRPNSLIWYLSPYYKQTKAIAFKYFKKFIPKALLAKPPHETDLTFNLINGSEIALKGTDNKDTLVGVGLTYVVLDECALMASDTWFHIIRPMLVDANPPAKALFISTPRGFNWFYDIWKRAEHDDDFDRWHFTTRDNKAIVNINKEVDNAYKDALTDYDRLIFTQEYEAKFQIVSGRIRFDAQSLEKLARETRQPRKEGSLYVYEPRQPRIHYTVGVDTSEGLISGDYSSVVIINCHTFAVDAVYYGKEDVDNLAVLVERWARQYNDALVVVEDNNHGLAVLNTLKKTYWNLYHRKQFDERTNTWTKKVGFRTTVRTKPLLVATIDKCLKEGFKVPDKRMVEELSTYIIDDDGKTCAQEGCHDDTVMALGCALQGYTESTKKDEFKDEEILPRYCYARIKRKYEVKEERLSPLSLSE